MIDYRVNTPIEVDILTALYTSVQWTGYTDHPEKMARLLDGSYYYVSAFEEEKLVGLIRAIGDGASILYIQDILVDPTYQRRGIGSQLMQRLVADNSDIRQMVLITDDTVKTKTFYASLGFSPIQDLDGVAFVKYDFSH